MLARTNFRANLLFSILAVFIASSWHFSADAVGAEDFDFFEQEIRPLLIEHCYECHGPKPSEIEGGLRLSSRAAILRGGDSGPAAHSADPNESLLIRAVRYNDPLLQMPPDDRLSRHQIEALEKWVSLGLPDPRQDTVRDSPATRSTESSNEDWWSFQPVAAPELPDVSSSSWPGSPIDAYVLDRLTKADMVPALKADRRSLVRRVYLDLVGLPPTPAEAEAFLTDPSDDAFPRLVDKLLASPHYGERWGRHWLDVVRYADTSGCNGDFPLPEAYRYRNYVINSWNADKPYDLFVQEQVAGDLLAQEPGKSDDQRYEQIVATGYLAISRRFSSLGEEFHLTLDDTVDNLGKAVLGLTISCARCHNHKFDPIPQTDYYGLYGIFASTTYAFPGTEIYRHTRHLVPLVPTSRLETELNPRLAKVDLLDEEIFATYTQMAAFDTGAEKDAWREKWKQMKDRRDAMMKALPEFERAYGATEGRPTNVALHIKGDPNNLGPEVPRGFLRILGGQQLTGASTDSGRIELANWLTSPDNPLIARVIVNRIWQHHFGKGMVRTPNDFGTRGAPPTHPGLLDFLSRRLIINGWSIKDLHRDIMLSETYQMAATQNDTYAKHDPDNRRLWTFERRRVDAETMRDTVLAVSGELDRTQGGAHPFPPEWDWRYSQHVPFLGDFPTNRRSVYLMQQRIRQQPYLAIFDGADTNMATGNRQVSTTPQQALFMLNSEFIHEQADYFAERVMREEQETREQIRLAFDLALSRPPLPTEIDEAADHVERARANLVAMAVPQSDKRALASFLRALLSSNEFMFID